MKKLKNKKLKDAILNCKKVWEWLADNPEKRKEDWPGWKNITAINYCFACDYARRAENDIEVMCQKCFLLPTWTGGKELMKDFYLYPCETLAVSPYAKWLYITQLLDICKNTSGNKPSILLKLLKEKIKCANDIVTGCNLVLKNLM